MTTIATIVGARPQFIKAAVVSRRLRAQTGWRELLIHTGQHYDDNMSRIFFDELGLAKPDVNLGIGSGAHGAQTGRMLEGIERVLQNERPDLVLIYGDTNSTLAGALAAAKLHIPVAHVEAGLRSFNRCMPEELNRLVADVLADLLFAPSEAAAANLRREGIPPEKIFQVGDVMYDAVLEFGPIAESHSEILKKNDLQPQKYVLATIHRAENTDSADRLAAIFDGLAATSEQTPVILPMHPRTHKLLRDSGIESRLPTSLQRIDPVSYFDMLVLERNARLVVTDSGGVQKEAFFHKVPCLTLRTETEWPELVTLGCNQLVPPTTAEEIGEAIRRALASPNELPDVDLYGSGKASHSVVQVLREKLDLVS